MTLEHAICSLPFEQWMPRQVIVLDWHDGPREGIAELSAPECEFHFEILAERYDPVDVDDRLFRLSEVPRGSVRHLLTQFRILGQPVNAVWSPVWSFTNDEDRLRCDQELKHILDLQRKTDVVILTKDMEHFLGCFQVPLDASQVDWFKALGIR